jgi:Tat protein secretion system quality control protein TatD with DNase activity
MFRGVYNGKEKHASDLDAVLDRCWAAGLEKIMVTGGSLKDSEEAIDFAKRDGRYRRPGILCTPQNFAPSSKFLRKKYFLY